MIAALTLSREQDAAVREAKTLTHGAMFVTGNAGTGKSVVLRAVRDSRPVIVLAPTGLAAINVGGMTIHRFFKINPMRPLSSQLGDRGPKFQQLVKAAGLIAIDEISMVRADMLDAIDRILRETMGVSDPFGGVPMMFVGDPFQLEPVTPDADRPLLAGYESPFFFDSRVYREAGTVYHGLTHIYRQSDGPFVAALNAIRRGEVSGLPTINARRDFQPEGAIALCHTNAAAHEINERALAEIDAPESSFVAVVRGFTEKEFPVPETLRVKPGCRVLICVNGCDYLTGEAYVNGDFGTVVEIGRGSIRVQLDRTGGEVTLDPYTWEKKRYDAGLQGELIEGADGLSFTQLPIRLGYAVTVHKSQGQTLDRAHALFETSSRTHGLAYVALSRVRTLEGLTIGRRLEAADVYVRPRVQEWVFEQTVSRMVVTL